MAVRFCPSGLIIRSLKIDDVNFSKLILRVSSFGTALAILQFRPWNKWIPHIFDYKTHCLFPRIIRLNFQPMWNILCQKICVLRINRFVDFVHSLIQSRMKGNHSQMNKISVYCEYYPTVIPKELTKKTHSYHLLRSVRRHNGSQWDRVSSSSEDACSQSAHSQVDATMQDR